MIEFVFWAALIGAVYSYAIYPLLLTMLPERGRVVGHQTDVEGPLVTP